jgi:hypothetical protein
MKKQDLTVIVKNFCMKLKVSRYSFSKYDGSDEWIMRRLLEYADICRNLKGDSALRSNAMHAYTLIHDLCDSEDREKIRYLYHFYQTARRNAISGYKFG